MVYMGRFVTFVYVEFQFTDIINSEKKWQKYVIIGNFGFRIAINKTSRFELKVGVNSQELVGIDY